MFKSNWKGNISFGLVNVPIVLFNSIDPSSGISFKQINKKTKSPIKYKRIDSKTEKEVPWEDIIKGYKYSQDLILPVEEGELKRVAGDNARTIAIEEFVDKKNIDFLRIEHVYYLVPDKKGEKAYIILREALKSLNKVGIAKVIISTKEYLSAIASYGEDALVLYLLHYDEEIRKITEFDLPNNNFKQYKVSVKEIDVAKKLINAMSAKWKPEKYKDEYKRAVETWLKDKINHLPQTTMKSRVSAKKPRKIINFVDLLKKSLNVKKFNGKSTNKLVKKKSYRSAHTIKEARH